MLGGMTIMILNLTSILRQLPFSLPFLETGVLLLLAFGAGLGH